MPVCDICSEHLVCDAELQTHLLLTHLEGEVRCPLCSLCGVSYDELRVHVDAAHSETADSGETRAGFSIASPSETAAGKQSAEAGESRTMGPLLTEHTHLSSPSNDRMFSCPLCNLTYSDCFMLQEHVEEHLQDRAVTDEAVYVCPMCEVVCDDCCSLQEHVELHLDCSASDNDDVHGDLQFAQQLQEEEEQHRKKEEEKREAEEFTRLQKQFGLDNGGGYCKQMERSMERAVSRGHMTPAEFHLKRVEMMETLVSGHDDGHTRTSGLISALYDFYQRKRQQETRVWLCSELDHFSSSDGDRGWGCGYRNLQMLLSSLQRLEQYSTLHTLRDALPSIPRLQALIEAAWAEGIDPQGASHFNGRLKGTRAWIGATEIYSILTSLHLRARIVDFHRPGPNNTHTPLFHWVKSYYSHTPSTALQPRVVKTNLPPIYLQHHGHSRTIVGVEEQRSGEVRVLVFDPECNAADMQRCVCPGVKAGAFARLRRSLSDFTQPQYQVLTVAGVLSDVQKRECVINSRTLQAERIP